jgi:hypothetical protein
VQLDATTPTGIVAFGIDYSGAGGESCMTDRCDPVLGCLAFGEPDFSRCEIWSNGVVDRCDHPNGSDKDTLRIKANLFGHDIGDP